MTALNQDYKNKKILKGCKKMKIKNLIKGL